MKTKVVAVYADKSPKKGVINPGPHQTYRNPRIRVEERELGSLHPDEIRVKMLYVGLCGTDLHLVETNSDTGYVRCSSPAEIPLGGRVIGHEGVGKVITIGSNVRRIKPDSYVTFESIIICHCCDMCRKGMFNQCRQAQLLGLERDGLFGTIVDIPSQLSHDVTALAKNDKGLRAAACVEPAGVAYVACQNAHIAAGDVVVIFGAGPIGLLCAMLSKTVFCASAVYVIEPVEYRRRLAQKWSDNVYETEEFFNNYKRCIDVVIEASGYLVNISRVFRRLNPNARIALLGRSGESLVLDAIDHMITNAISLVGSRGNLGGAFEKIINLYSNGRLPINEIVTDIVKGPEGLMNLLNNPCDILNRNCKVLASFDE